jgi:hypothetical protein
MRGCMLIRNSSMLIHIHSVVFAKIKVSDKASNEPTHVEQSRMGLKCCV